MKKFIYTILFLSIFVLTSSSPSDPLERLIQNLDSYFKEVPQEKVYLQFDRPGYTSGDVLRFNGYVLAGVQNVLSPLSKNLYIELLDNQNNVIHEVMLYVRNGQVEGSIDLPMNLKSDDYLVRAYTLWMLNSPHDYIFSQIIPIISLFEKFENTLNDPIKDNQPNLMFFPEGGNLVKGIPTRLAFKATDNQQKGLAIEGTIFDEKGTRITTFKSNELGMGVVDFTPEASAYYAEINDFPHRYNFPPIFNEGLVMNVFNNSFENDIKLRIRTNYSVDDEFLVLTHSRGALFNLQKVKLSNNTGFVRISKENALQGITHITVFTSKMVPLAERLVFIDNGNYLKFNINTSKNKVNKRELVNSEITVTDKDGKPVEASFTISVYAQNQLYANNTSRNFITYSQLESDLVGTIENPFYYFDESNEGRHIDMDVLLMTQGWRRFKWEDMLNGMKEPEYFIETGILLEGTLVNDLNKKPIEGGKITFFSKDSEDGFIQTASGKSGRFSISDLVFYDDSEINLQGENAKGKKFAEVHLDSKEKVYPNDFETPFIAEQRVFEKEHYNKLLREAQTKIKNDAARNFEDGHINLGEVVIESEREQLEDRIERMYGKGDVQFVPSEWQGIETANSIFEMMQGRLAGVMVTPDGSGGYSVTIRGQGSFNGTMPLLLVNNMPINADFLNAINPRDVELIEVYKGPSAAIFGSAGGAGAISIYLKKGSNYGNIVKGLNSFDIKGFNRYKEFYAPDYSQASEKDTMIDSRTTVYWKSQIFTDKNGKSKISYYHSDNTGEFVVKIEGISSDGKIGAHISTLYYCE
jgi:hypothetical protein